MLDFAVMHPGGSNRSLSPEIQVLLADPHRMFLDGVVPALESQPGIGRVLGTCSMTEAFQRSTTFGPDVIVLSPALAAPNPFRPAAQLREATEIKLLLLDDCVRAIHLRVALALGTSYWTKHVSIQDLALALRRAAAGLVTFAPAAERHLVFAENAPRLDPASPAAAIGILTCRELEVFVCLAQGLSVRRCAERLTIAVATVENHKARLMRKLRVHKSIDLAWLAIRAGMLDGGYGDTLPPHGG